jgi:hypothetical protein
MRPHNLMAILIALIPISLGNAHEIADRHTCVKPHYSIDYSDEEQLANLYDDMLEYRACLLAFMQSQIDESTAHSEAGMNAIEESSKINSDFKKHAPRELMEAVENLLEQGEP